MFDRDNLSTTLSATPAFSGFSKSEIKSISQKFQHRIHVAGDQLTRQGEFGAELLVVLKGTASVDIGGKAVAQISEGGVIGEIALLDHLPRTATIIATSDMEVGVLTVAAFEELTKQTPAFWRVIALGLAQRLRQEDRSYHHH